MDSLPSTGAQLGTYCVVGEPELEGLGARNQTVLSVQQVVEWVVAVLRSSHAAIVRRQRQADDADDLDCGRRKRIHSP
jgi:hypothetical protein